MILAAFGLMDVRESSVLGAVRVLHVFRHFMIIIIVIIIIINIIIVIIIMIIIIIIIAAVITININIIFITFIIIRLFGFFIKNSLLFL